jgi:hypothetical protein
MTDNFELKSRGGDRVPCECGKMYAEQTRCKEIVQRNQKLSVADTLSKKSTQ